MGRKQRKQRRCSGASQHCQRLCCSIASPGRSYVAFLPPPPAAAVAATAAAIYTLIRRGIPAGAGSAAPAAPPEQWRRRQGGPGPGRLPAGSHELVGKADQPVPYGVSRPVPGVRWRLTPCSQAPRLTQSIPRRRESCSSASASAMCSVFSNRAAARHRSSNAGLVPVLLMADLFRRGGFSVTNIPPASIEIVASILILGPSFKNHERFALANAYNVNY